VNSLIITPTRIFIYRKIPQWGVGFVFVLDIVPKIVNIMLQYFNLGHLSRIGRRKNTEIFWSQLPHIFLVCCVHVLRTCLMPAS
jgi:hypothetical protein